KTSASLPWTSGHHKQRARRIPSSGRRGPRTRACNGRPTDAGLRSTHTRTTPTTSTSSRRIGPRPRARSPRVRSGRPATRAGRPTAFHEFRSDQLDSGISPSVDGRWVAFIAPDREGHLQVFRVPLAGGAPQQLTFDPTDKTQPAYDPTGRWIAFTVFNYLAQFWMLEP